MELLKLSEQWFIFNENKIIEFTVRVDQKNISLINTTDMVEYDYIEKDGTIWLYIAGQLRGMIQKNINRSLKFTRLVNNNVIYSMEWF